MSALRWGVAATGSMSAAFTEDLQRATDVEVVAVGSRTLASAQAFASRYGIARPHGSYESLVNDPNVDVIYIGGTNDMHFPVGYAALDAGKHVLCEKPLTLHAKQAEELIALSRERGLFFMEAMWMRCNPGIRLLQEILASGRLGTVRHVAASLAFGFPDGIPPRLLSPELGGGALVDMGIYPLTLARLLLGWPSNIVASGVVVDGIDLATSIAASWESGATASLACSMLASIPNTATIVTDQAVIHLPALFLRPGHIRIEHHDHATEQIETPVGGNGYLPEIDEVTAGVAAGAVESPVVTHEESIAMMQLMDRLRAQLGVHFP